MVLRPAPSRRAIVTGRSTDGVGYAGRGTHRGVVVDAAPDTSEEAARSWPAVKGCPGGTVATWLASGWPCAGASQACPRFRSRSAARQSFSNHPTQRDHHPVAAAAKCQSNHNLAPRCQKLLEGTGYIDLTTIG